MVFAVVAGVILGEALSTGKAVPPDATVRTVTCAGRTRDGALRDLLCSGPLSERRNSGAPRVLTGLARTSITLGADRATRLFFTGSSLCAMSCLYEFQWIKETEQVSLPELHQSRTLEDLTAAARRIHAFWVARRRQGSDLGGERSQLAALSPGMSTQSNKQRHQIQVTPKAT